jgi:hypothetical protein
VTYLDVPMPYKIELGETANISPARYKDREIMEEIDDGGCTLWEREPKYKRCQDDGNDFMREDHYFHREQLPKFLVDL